MASHASLLLAREAQEAFHGARRTCRPVSGHFPFWSLWLCPHHCLIPGTCRRRAHSPPGSGRLQRPLGAPSGESSPHCRDRRVRPPQTPGSADVTLFGKELFAGMIKLRIVRGQGTLGHLGGSQIQGQDSSEETHSRGEDTDPREATGRRGQSGGSAESPAEDAVPSTSSGTGQEGSSQDPGVWDALILICGPRDGRGPVSDCANLCQWPK